jgi:hypothetical protein
LTVSWARVAARVHLLRLVARATDRPRAATKARADPLVDLVFIMTDSIRPKLYALGEFVAPLHAPNLADAIAGPLTRLARSDNAS